MKRIFCSLLVALCLVSPLAFAQDTPDAGVTADAGLVPGPNGTAVPVPVNTEDPGEILSYIARAFNGKTWGAFAAGVLMLLVWVGRLIMPRLPAKALPWVAASLGMLFAVATALSVGWVWWRAILNGLTVGFAAGGLWSLLGKYLLPTKDAEKK